MLGAFLVRAFQITGSSRGFDHDTSAAIETTMRVPVACVGQAKFVKKGTFEAVKKPATTRNRGPRQKRGTGPPAARPGAPATASAKVPSRLISGAAPAL